MSQTLWVSVPFSFEWKLIHLSHFPITINLNCYVRPKWWIKLTIAKGLLPRLYLSFILVTLCDDIFLYLLGWVRFGWQINELEHNNRHSDELKLLLFLCCDETKLYCWSVGLCLCSELSINCFYHLSADTNSPHLLPPIRFTLRLRVSHETKFNAIFARTHSNESILFRNWLTFVSENWNHFPLEFERNKSLAIITKRTVSISFSDENSKSETIRIDECSLVIYLLLSSNTVRKDTQHIFISLVSFSSLSYSTFSVCAYGKFLHMQPSINVFIAA